MKMIRIFFAVFGFALLVGAFLRPALADEWDKTTKITFKEPVQVPGKVLPAGTYVFKLLDSTSDRHVVQIFNEDHTQLITTVLAVPNERLDPAGKTILTYQERPADQPMALSAWFYPGDNMGQQFVYPKSEAEQLSRLNKQEVPSTGSEDVSPKLQDRSTEAAQNQNPTPPAETQAAPPTQPTSPPPVANSTAAEQSKPSDELAKNAQPQLPHTATMLPLAGLIGISLLAIAGFLRVLIKA